MRPSAQPHRAGQAMVEFALVLPLVLVILFIVISVSLIYSIKIEQQKATYNAAVYLARLSSDPNKPHAAPFETLDTLPPGTLTDPDYWSTDTTQGALRVHALAVAIDVALAQKSVRPAWVETFTDDRNALCPGAQNNPEVKTGPDLPGAPAHFYSVQSIEIRYCYHLKTIPGWNQLAALWGTKSSGGGLLEERAIAARLPSEF
ncbi:MAG: hypothetical protein NVSMB17_12310 [Candidatus Dormibacteria bacterium]